MDFKLKGILHFSRTQPRNVVRAIFSQLKAGIFCPSYKEGQEDPDSYRSVSLTLALGKITEKISQRSIEKHLKDNEVIGHRQDGFTRGKPCLTNLISFYDKVTQGKSVNVLVFFVCLLYFFFNFSKAFDTASHTSSGQNVQLTDTQIHNVIG